MFCQKIDLQALEVMFQKRVRVFHRGFKHEKTDKSISTIIFENIQQLRSRYLAVCQFRANTLLRKANDRVQI